MKRSFGITLIFTAVLLMAVLNSCKKKTVDPIEPPVEPQKTEVILDTDIGSSTDDLFAMEILYKLIDEGEINLKGVIVDRMGNECARAADVMNTYYGHPRIPIGLERNGVDAPVFNDYRNIADWTDSLGNKLFKTSIENVDDCLDAYKLYRKILSESDDNSVNIISIGFLTSLANLLESEADEYSPLNGVDLVAKKVKCVYMMGGAFDGQAEYNFSLALPYAKTFFDKWPSTIDVLMSPAEVGDNINYKTEMVLNDFSWVTINPIKEIYMRLNVDDGQRMWDPLAVLNMIEPSLFKLSEKGYAIIHDDATMSFIPDVNGNYRYQLAGDDDWNNMILERIRMYSKI